MVVNAGIVSAVRGALLDISALPIPLSIIVIPRVILQSKIYQRSTEFQPGLFYRKLTKYYKEELPNLLVRPVVVLMDVTYRGRNFGVVIMKDSLSGDVLWFKFIKRISCFTTDFDILI